MDSLNSRKAKPQEQSEKQAQLVKKLKKKHTIGEIKHIPVLNKNIDSLELRPKLKKTLTIEPFPKEIDKSKVSTPNDLPLKRSNTKRFSLKSKVKYEFTREELLEEGIKPVNELKKKVQSTTQF